MKMRLVVGLLVWSVCVTSVMGNFVVPAPHLQSAIVNSTKQNDDCLLSFRSPVKAKIHCGYDFRECSNAALEKTFPSLYNRSVLRAPSPASVSPEAFCKGDKGSANTGTDLSRSAINISWKLPDDQGALLIKGFDIRVEGHKRSYRCIAVQLLEDITSSGASFSGTLYSMEQNKQYVITLQSLPRNNVSGTVEKYVTTPECVASTSASWAVKRFNVTYYPVSQRLAISFERPPAKFEFDEFDLTLCPLDYSVVMRERINRTEHTFENIVPGVYNIMLQPYDPYFQQEGKCKCLNSRNLCSSCLMSETRYVAKPAQTGSKVQSNPSEITLAVMCVVAAIILVIIGSILIVCRHRILQWCGKPSTDIIGKSRVLIVFIDTSEQLTHGPNALEKSGMMLSSIEKYITQISQDTDVKVEQNVLNLKDDINSRLIEIVTKTWFSTEKDADLICNKQKTASPMEEAPAIFQNDYCVVCCFVLQKSVTCEVIKAINESVENYKVDYNTRVSKVTMTFHDVTPAFHTLSRKMECYKLPDDHDKFLKYIENLSRVTNNGNDTDTITSEDTQRVAITVDLDKIGSSKQVESNVNINPKSPRMEILLRLDVPKSARERFTSNDSGRGGSVASFKSGFIDDNLDGRDTSDDNEHDCLLSDHDIDACRNNCDSIDGALRLGCPSQIDFVPPEPSEVSDSDILERYQRGFTGVPNDFYNAANHHQPYVKGIGPVRNTCDVNGNGCIADMEKVENRLAHLSMGSTLNKMSINGRNAIRYASNDSGNSDSAGSFKNTSIGESLDNRHCSNGCQYVSRNNTANSYCTDISEGDLRPMCPPNMDFASPEPSDVSESDVIESYRKNAASVPNEYYNTSNRVQPCVRNSFDPLHKPCKIYDQGQFSDMENVEKEHDNSSMDVIMNKMAAINARSLYAMDVIENVGETYSVFEWDV